MHPSVTTLATRIPGMRKKREEEYLQNDRFGRQRHTERATTTKRHSRKSTTNFRPFNISNDANDTAVRWTKWKKDIERQFRFFGLTDPVVKKDGLIIYGGSQIADLEESLPDLPPQESEDVYSRFIRKLDRNFLPRKSRDYARFQF